MVVYLADNKREPEDIVVAYLQVFLLYRRLPLQVGRSGRQSSLLSQALDGFFVWGILGVGIERVDLRHRQHVGQRI